MVDHVKPTIREDTPDNIILHPGTNDLRSEKTSSQIAKAIIELAMLLKTDENSVIVSSIVPRFDNFNNKANEVNNPLVHICRERDIPFISHTESIDPSKYLNESKFHLNFNGVKILAENLSTFLSEINWPQQQITSLSASLLVNSERVCHSVETSESESNDTFDPKIELRNLRLKNPN